MKSYPNLPYSHNSLKVFESVARRLSFTQAAEELHVTQSAVSRQIKQLELELNTALIRRKHRSIELTEQGRELFEVLRSNYQELQSLLEQWQTPVKKRLVIKSALSFATRILIPKVVELNERYPEHEIVIIPAIEEDPDLRHEQCDILILNTRQPELYRGKPRVTFLREEFMAPVYAAGAETTRLELPDVLGMPRLHATEDHYDWQVWLSSIEQRVATPVRNTSFLSLDLALSACLAGQGATVTDLMLVLPELKRGFLHTPIDSPIRPSAWQYFVYCPHNSELASDLCLWLQSLNTQQEHNLRDLAKQYRWNID
ncbi:LysR family transcriptional regulator [Vibrio scophthalmi]|uniref:LysR family transcriptional regulator n=1 Tax=Vibrio scophthalmi TaxID=45658 RepID=UPI0022848C4F|nr:LysR family transcriptional regulator [Vibrio scophthalmi]MCY9803864.1 LysR family transcriptional regulator [Vibrio scophthalmi]